MTPVNCTMENGSLTAKTLSMVAVTGSISQKTAALEALLFFNPNV